MDIKYLKILRDHPTENGMGTGRSTTNRPMQMGQISTLEQLYNGGSPFPQALKELLFLAGEYCYVLDYGLEDTREEMQEDVRNNMVEDNLIIARPFFAIDVYNDGDQFVFVYLDEEEDPIVHEGSYRASHGLPRIRKLSYRLSDLVSKRVIKAQSGFNPF